MGGEREKEGRFCNEDVPKREVANSKTDRQKAGAMI